MGAVIYCVFITGSLFVAAPHSSTRFCDRVATCARLIALFGTVFTWRDTPITCCRERSPRCAEIRLLCSQQLGEQNGTRRVSARAGGIL